MIGNMLCMSKLIMIYNNIYKSLDSLANIRMSKTPRNNDEKNTIIERSYPYGFSLIVICVEIVYYYLLDIF